MRFLSAQRQRCREPDDKLRLRQAEGSRESSRSFNGPALHRFALVLVVHWPTVHDAAACIGMQQCGQGPLGQAAACCGQVAGFGGQGQGQACRPAPRAGFAGPRSSRTLWRSEAAGGWWAVGRGCMTTNDDRHGDTHSTTHPGPIGGCAAVARRGRRGGFQAGTYPVATHPVASLVRDAMRCAS